VGASRFPSFCSPFCSPNIRLRAPRARALLVRLPDVQREGHHPYFYGELIPTSRSPQDSAYRPARSRAGCQATSGVWLCPRRPPTWEGTRRDAAGGSVRSAHAPLAVRAEGSRGALIRALRRRVRPHGHTGEGSEMCPARGAAASRQGARCEHFAIDQGCAQRILDRWPTDTFVLAPIFVGRAGKEATLFLKSHSLRACVAATTGCRGSQRAVPGRVAEASQRSLSCLSSSPPVPSVSAHLARGEPKKRWSGPSSW
jgi:hypothetical protein